MAQMRRIRLTRIHSVGIYLCIATNEDIGLATLQRRHKLSKGSLVEPVIGVEDLEVATSCLSNGEIDDGAPPSIGFVDDTEDLREAYLVLASKGKGAVLAAIVDGKDFQHVVVLGVEDAIQAFGQILLNVVAGDYYG